jgi:hypothetical protein
MQLNLTWCRKLLVKILHNCRFWLKKSCNQEFQPLQKRRITTPLHRNELKLWVRSKGDLRPVSGNVMPQGLSECAAES